MHTYNYENCQIWCTVVLDATMQFWQTYGVCALFTEVSAVCCVNAEAVLTTLTKLNLLDSSVLKLTSIALD